MSDILRVGTSAGGARAKAVISWHRTSNEVRSGQLPADVGFESWLLKFDGVGGNRDNGKQDGFMLDDFKACAAIASMKRSRAEVIFNEVRLVVAQWQGFAAEAGVAVEWVEKIRSVLRLDRF